MEQAYEKPFRSVDEQLELLERRGMDLGNRDEAAAWLRRVGYYRLSGYWYPWRRSMPRASGPPLVLDEFVQGTTLADVVATYEFDRRLRLHVLDAVERVEVAMRFHVGHTLGRRGAFAHADPQHLDDAFAGAVSPAPALHRWMQSDHAGWLSVRRREQERSKADFVQHFRHKYGAPLPVWVVTELMDLGGLSRLYAGLRQRDRDLIAAELGLRDASGAGHGGALKDWLKNISYVRNVCAHHARFWNANVTERISPRTIRPIHELEHIAASPSATTRPYASLAVLALLARRVHPADDWASRLVRLVDDALPLSRGTREMGFPDGWRTLGLWSGA